MKKISLLKRLLLLGVPALVVAFAFNNCGGSEFATADYSSLADPLADGGGPLDTGGGGSTGDGTTHSNSTPYALLNSEQVLKSMLNVTGQTVTAAQTTEYNRRSGALAAGSELSLLNSPMLVGISSLAGEVCNGLVAKESALATNARAFFPSVNFAQGVSALSEASYVEAVHLMSRAFLGRDESADEAAIFKMFRDEFVATMTTQQKSQSAGTRSLLIGTCAGLLASFDAYTY